MSALSVRSPDQLVLNPDVLLALIASALVVFGSPYVGEIRGAVESRFPHSYRTIMAGVVAAAIIGAIAAAVARIRQPQRNRSTPHARYPPSVRYALIAAAIVIGLVYATVARSGNVDADIVELFHFVEYGLIASLFYRTWRTRADVSAAVLPACAALVVGTADEAVQWFVPGRVGELHDVWLNGVAAACGLLVSIAIAPPPSLALPRDHTSRRRIAGMVVVVMLAIAAFVDRVHVGHEIHDRAAGTFRSQHDANGLAAAARDRPLRWQTSPPVGRAFSREDRYFSEGLWHVQRRNLAVTAADFQSAWNENIILDRFYAPVLDLGFRWSREQEAQIAQQARSTPPASYVSDAEPYPIYVINRWAFWAVVASAMLTLLWLGFGRTSGEVSRTV